MALTKDQILAARDRKPIKVLTPEWATDGADCVYVIGLTGDQRDALDTRFAAQAKEKGMHGLRAYLLAHTLCDEGGKLLGFTERETIDLGNKSAAAIERVFDAAREASGLGVEQAAKN